MQNNASQSEKPTCSTHVTKMLFFVFKLQNKRMSPQTIIMDNVRAIILVIN